MADITKCLGKGCKKRNKCYRYRAIANPMYQSYSQFEDVCKAPDYSEYWDIKGYDERRLSSITKK